MTNQQMIVRNIHESLNNDRLKIEVDKNSRGYNVSVSYRGGDEEDVISTVVRVMRETESRLEGE